LFSCAPTLPLPIRTTRKRLQAALRTSESREEENQSIESKIQKSVYKNIRFRSMHRGERAYHAIAGLDVEQLLRSALCPRKTAQKSDRPCV
jgi:hypothetical protein